MGSGGDSMEVLEEEEVPNDMLAERYCWDAGTMGKSVSGRGGAGRAMGWSSSGKGAAGICKIAGVGTAGGGWGAWRGREYRRIGKRRIAECTRWAKEPEKGGVDVEDEEGLAGGARETIGEWIGECWRATGGGE